MNKTLVYLLVLVSSNSFADTINTKVKILGGTDGTTIGNVSDSAKVNVTNSVAVTGGLTDSQLRASPVPVSAASLPLPTGAATSAKQPALGTAGTASADVITVQGIASMIALKVDGSAVTQPVSAASLPLPSGAATSANQTTANTSLVSIDSKTPALGQALAAASSPVVLTAAQLTTLTPLSAVTANAGTNLNTSLLALDSTVAKDASLTTINTSVNTLLKPASTLAAVTTVGTITNSLPTGTNSIGQVTANAGTNLNTSLLQLDATGAKLNNTQASTTSGQTGPLIQGAVTTASPAYTTAQTSPLSLTTAGALRTDSSAVTQPVSAASLPLPALASTSTKQSDGTQKTQVVDGANATVGPVTTLSGTNYLPVVLAASSTAGAAIPSRSVQVSGSDGTNAQNIAVDTSGRIRAPVNVTGSGSAAAATVSTVATLTAPANAVGFILMNLDTSTTSMRWAVGRTASTTLGQQLQPGRDTGFIPIGANISIIAESGTVTYDVQWVSQ